jgi:hypothetical protein
VSVPHHSNPSILRVAVSCSQIPAGQSSISLLSISARQGVPVVVESPKSARAVICPFTRRLPDPVSLAVELAPAPCGEQAENGKHRHPALCCRIRLADTGGPRSHRSALAGPPNRSRFGEPELVTL